MTIRSQDEAEFLELVEIMLKKNDEFIEIFDRVNVSADGQSSGLRAADLFRIRVLINEIGMAHRRLKQLQQTGA